MSFDLSQRRALVLGGSNGIGFAIANRFAGAGATVALTSRTADRAVKAADRIGKGATGLVCDTGEIATIESAFEEATAALGGIDILVLNSGGPRPGGAQGIGPQEWRQAFEAMFVGLVRMADLCLPAMIEAGFGRLMIVASSGIIEPIPNLAISNTIRPALVGWAKTLATEVAGHGVTVNTIVPGRIATDRLGQLDKANAERLNKSIEEVQAGALARIPAGRYGTPDEFAAAAHYLASDEAAFVTGGIHRVDGGLISATH